MSPLLLFFLVNSVSADPNRIAAQMAQQCLSSVDALNSAGKSKSCRKEGASVPYPTTRIAAANGKEIEVSIVPKEELKNLFYFVTTLGLPWKKTSFCSHRAHVMAYDLYAEKKIMAGKLMTQPKRWMGVFPGSITPQYEEKSRRKGWDYHVAPFVAVENNGKIEQWVIDPSTFTEPVPREKWEAFQENRAKTYVTDRFAFDLYDVNRTDLNSYTGDKSIAHVLQVMRENGARP